MTTLIRKSLLNNSLLNNSLTHKGYLLSQRLLTTKTLQLNNTTENVYIKDENSDNMFINSLKKSRINSIGVVGWGSQGQAQAQNLRDTINRLNLNIPVIIGLRQHSKSAFKAMELGFEVNNIEDVLSSCDLNLMLISDYAQSTDYEHYFSYLKKFYYLHMDNLKRDNHNFYQLVFFWHKLYNYLSHKQIQQLFLVFFSLRK